MRGQRADGRLVNVVNPRRFEAPDGQLRKRTNVSAEAPLTIHPRLRSRTARQIGHQIARDLAECPRPRQGALAGEVNGVRDLRVPEPLAGAAARALRSEVHTAQARALHDPAVGSQLTGKVDVFEPAVKRQGSVEAKSVLSDRCEPDGHIAAIGVVDIFGRPATVLACGTDDALCLLEIEARRQYAVR